MGKLFRFHNKMDEKVMNDWMDRLSTKVINVERTANSARDSIEAIEEVVEPVAAKLRWRYMLGN